MSSALPFAFTMYAISHILGEMKRSKNGEIKGSIKAKTEVKMLD